MTDSSSQKKYGFRGERVDGVEPGQDARLAAHVVGLRWNRAERRTAQDALQSPTLKRYVRLEAPEGNCLTSSSPSGTSSTCARR